MNDLMTSQMFPDLLRVGIRKIFLNEYNSYPELYSKLMRVENSNKAYEEELVMAGFGLIPEWNADGQELPTDKILTGDRIVYVHKDYGMMWSVSKRLLREDLYGKVGKNLVQEATRAMKTTIEVVAHGIFNNAFGGTRPLCANNQPLIGGGTFSNRLTVALDATGLQLALERFRRWVNHRNQPIVIEPKILLVPPELEHMAKTLLQSTMHPNAEYVSGSSGAITAQQNRMPTFPNTLKSAVDSLVVSPYLTDTNNWFLMASPKETKINFFWREKPTIETDEKDFRTKGVSHSITCAFSVGFTDWYGVLGSEVS